MDLILSSGFLAFARHAGVLAAIEARSLGIDAVVGTSSGAMVGALWAAGLPAEAIMRELAEGRPIDRMRLSWTPWRGVFRLDRVIARLAQHLPRTFAELPRPLGVGVVDGQGVHRLITEGPLVEAVVASCAMPYVFERVRVGDAPHYDGGAADRLGLAAWRAWRGGEGRTAIAHQVQRTRGIDVPADLTGVTLIQTPRSGASFWSLGDWQQAMAEARQIAEGTLDGMRGNGSGADDLRRSTVDT